jgi:hypothetical protein
MPAALLNCRISKRARADGEEEPRRRWLRKKSEKTYGFSRGEARATAAPDARLRFEVRRATTGVTRT